MSLDTHSKISILNICSLDSEREFIKYPHKVSQNFLKNEMKYITKPYETSKLFSYYLKKKYMNKSSINKNNLKDVDKYKLSNYLTISNNFLTERNKKKFEFNNCIEKEYFLSYKNNLNNKLISLNNINIFFDEKKIEKEKLNILNKELRIKKNMFSYNEEYIREKQNEEEKEDFLFLISHNRENKKEHSSKLQRKKEKIENYNKTINEDLRIGNFDISENNENKKKHLFNKITNIKKNIQIKNRIFLKKEDSNSKEIQKNNKKLHIYNKIDLPNMKNMTSTIFNKTKLRNCNSNSNFIMKESMKERINKIEFKYEKDYLEMQNKLYLKKLSSIEKRILKRCYSNKKIKLDNSNKNHNISY